MNGGRKMNGQKIDGQKLESLKNQLIVQHKNLSKTLKTMKENGEAKPDPNTPGELSNYDNHPADLGSQLYELEQNMALKTHEESLRVKLRMLWKELTRGSTESAKAAAGIYLRKGWRRYHIRVFA